jgi:hypothetical protein
MSTPLPGAATEEWRPVVGYEDRYEVSDQGRVRSLIHVPHYDGTDECTTIIYVLTLSNAGRAARGEFYLKARLSLNGITRSFLVHVLVLNAFVGPCPLGMETRHLNGKPYDNRLSNLCWGTPVENAADAIRHAALRAEASS